MRWLLPLAVLCLAPSALAGAPGPSAQLLTPTPETQRDLEVTVRLEDPREIVTAVSVELRRVGAEAWTRYAAERRGLDFVARIPAAHLPPPGEHLELRAELFGKRGGLLFELGFDEPVRARVRSAPEAREEDRAFGARVASSPSPTERTGVSALVAIDTRLNSRARLRAALGVSFTLSPRLELGLFLSVGPSLAAPPSVASGGPVVVGSEVGLRAWARRASEGLGVYLEPFVGGDLRLPGFDPGGGLRAGLLVPLEPSLALDLALGGSASVLNLVGVDESPELGFGAQLRIGVRFQEP